MRGCYFIYAVDINVSKGKIIIIGKFVLKIRMKNMDS